MPKPLINRGNVRIWDWRPKDIVTDIHGCLAVLERLLEKLGYVRSQGVWQHPERMLVVNGDLGDRGPDSLGVWQLVMDMVSGGHARYNPGNHDNKFYRWLIGRKVRVSHGLETTVAEFSALRIRERERFRRRVIRFFEEAPLYQWFVDEDLVVAHAGITEQLVGRVSARAEAFVLYGDVEPGQKDADGFPIRRNWEKDYHGPYTVVYGHTWHPEPHIVGRTFNIDTGAVFGHQLTALRFPEMELVSEPSEVAVPSGRPALERAPTRV